MLVCTRAAAHKDLKPNPTCQCMRTSSALCSGLLHVLARHPLPLHGSRGDSSRTAPHGLLRADSKFNIAWRPMPDVAIARAVLLEACARLPIDTASTQQSSGQLCRIKFMHVFGFPLPPCCSSGVCSTSYRTGYSPGAGALDRRQGSRACSERTASAQAYPSLVTQNTPTRSSSKKSG